MSHLLAPTHTVADAIPLGRRISEIMAEKGPAYTIAAMAKRLEINRETLRLMLKGEREIYTFELEKIAQDLKVPVERILQSDFVEESRLVKSPLLQKNNSEDLQNLELAKRIAERAIGLTERVIAENDLAFAYFSIEQPEVAYERLKNILTDAEQIFEKYDEPEIFLNVIGNMMQIKVKRNENRQLIELVAKAEPFFSTNPQIGGSMCHILAKIYEEQGDLLQAREKYDQMIYYFKMDIDSRNIAWAYLNIGVFEYQQKNYKRAFDFIIEAWDLACEYQELRFHLLAGREYGKILMRLEQTAKAIDVMSNLIGRLEDQKDTEYIYIEAQILLLLAIATQEPEHAERLLHKQIGSRSIRKLAAKFLVDTYEQSGEQAARAKYEQVLQEMPGTPLDMLLCFTKSDKYALLTLFDFCHQQGWHMPSLN